MFCDYITKAGRWFQIFNSLGPSLQLSFLWRTAFIFAIGTFGGLVASQLNVPLPFMLGALASSALCVGFAPSKILAGYALPNYLRVPFIALIGVAIGGQVHLEQIGDLRQILVLLIAVTIFTPLAHLGNYIIFSKLGRYDRPTAFYSAAPGGLIEALSLGENSGADVRILTIQQFLRIIFVVTILPMAISLWIGHPVGSASGASLAANSSTSPLWILAAIAGVGAALGIWLRIPAGQLTGPLIVAGLLTATGTLDITVSPTAIACAQIVLGVSLGLRFSGLTASLLTKSLKLAAISAGWMLGLGFALSLITIAVSPLALDIAILSMAPGGVTEMALIALSLGANPALVTTAHVYRIVLTVFIMGFAYKKTETQN